MPPGSVPSHRRREFTAFIEALDGKYVAVLAGLRRSGKSTLIHQAIEELLARGVKAKDIVYATFDDLAFLGSGPEVIQAVLDVREDVGGPATGGPIYAFFDEVQNIPEWGRALKVIWDRRTGVRLSATGSSGLIIRGVVGESLAGRATTMDIGPLEFRDWVTIASPTGGWGGQGAIPLAGLRNGSPPEDAFGGALEVLKARDAVRPFLGRYLILGGLPESTSATDETAYLNHIFESVIERILFRDLPSLYGLRQPDKIARLLLLLADKSGLPVSVDGVAETLKAHRETIEDYISFLIGSRVILEMLPYTGSEISSARKRRRYYLADTGLQNTILHRDSRSLLDDRVMGCIAEQAVAIHLNRLARRHWARLFTGPVHRGSEVDFVLDARDGPMPVECKYKGSVRGNEVASLDAYRKAIGAGTAIMVTKDRFERRGGCVLLPLWMFLLTE